MSSARDEILGRIRAALGRGEVDAKVAESLQQRMRQPPASQRPQWSEPLLARFQARVEAAAATIESVSDITEVPARVSAYMAQHKLGTQLAVAPALAALAWPAELALHAGAVRGEHPVSVTPCFAAVAETGSVVLISGKESPTSLNFLPDDHIVVVLAEQVVGHLEDVWTRLRDWPQFPVRTVNFITGPSRTADVEQTIQLGAHGPRRLHVILVGGG